MTGLQKQPISFNFNNGLDTKTDPAQVALGNFLTLENAVFQNGGGLQKRNGFGDLTALPVTEGTTLATFNDNLLATGSVLQAWSPATNEWLNRGTIQPVNITTKSLVRSSIGQTKPDAAVSANGLVCAVYVDSAPAYQIQNASTGQIIVSRVALPATATTPRVFLMPQHFVITFVATVAATATLQFIAIPYLQPSNPTSPATISTNVLSLSTGYDGYVTNGTLYLAWSGTDVGLEIIMAYINSSLVVSSSQTFAGHGGAPALTVTADESGTSPIIWVGFWESASTDGYAFAVTDALLGVIGFRKIISTKAVTHITSTAIDSVATFFYDIVNKYSWTGGADYRSDYIMRNTMNTSGTTGTETEVLRSVQLASKAFIGPADTTYMLAVYGSGASTGGPLQPTYFLINSTGQCIAKLAYSNGGGYYTDQKLPNISVQDEQYYVSYLFKDFLVSINTANGGTNSGNIYTQTGVNLAAIGINSTAQYKSEIAQSLHLTGGFMWQYDGLRPVEHGFHLYPEDVNVTTSTTGGAIPDTTVYYRVCYEWTDYQGNIHRSAPSLPVAQVTAGGNTSTNTIKVPTARITYKLTPNPVRIVLYRSSLLQQNYYQVSSVASPTANSTTTDSVTITDTLADSAIIGNTLLYTTGNVVENIAAPACTSPTLYKNRLILIDDEDRNLIWYSKQVVEAVPVEFSDLFTIYIAPTAGSQGPTGELEALSAMDDKLILFKHDAIYYITGSGPDSTGANNDFSEPIYITGTVGTTNPKSVVFTPVGVMFQSDKGIWLLGRDLSTKYIGAAVELYNTETVNSAICVPGTNQVRFSLDNGTVLMYDYYYDQWGTFTGIPNLSSVLYNGKHTYLAQDGGIIRQETARQYLDGSRPVLMSFTSAWIKLQGLQGYQRAYAAYLLSNYLTPYKLNVQLAYDYATSPSQTTLLTPPQTSNTWGSSGLWGGDPVWGLDSLDQRRVFLDRQRCQAVQISVSEIYNPMQDVQAGAGLTMSGISILIGAKKGWPTLTAKQSAG